VNKQEMQRVESEKNSCKFELKQKTKAEKELQRREKQIENDLRSKDKKLEDISNDLRRVNENQKTFEHKKEEKLEKIDQTEKERSNINAELTRKNEALNMKQVTIKNKRGDLARYKNEYSEKNNELKKLVSTNNRRNKVTTNETKLKRDVQQPKTRQPKYNNHSEMNIEHERNVINSNIA